MFTRRWLSLLQLLWVAQIRDFSIPESLCPIPREGFVWCWTLNLGKLATWRAFALPCLASCSDIDAPLFHICAGQAACPTYRRLCSPDRDPNRSPQGTAMVVGKARIWNDQDAGYSSARWLRDVGQVTFSPLNPSAKALHGC